MRFEKAFRLSSYGLLLSGFISLFASEAVGLPLTALYFLAVIASWKTRTINLANWLQFLVFLALLAFFVVDASILSDSVSATVHVLIFASLVKLYTRKAERDYLVLYFISFGFLLFASSYTISISFLAALVLYIFSSILTFILFESKKAYEENSSAGFSLKGYVNVALVITALIILISIPIFLVIPRATLGFFRVDRRLELNLSGFSDKVSLGDIGKIISNTNIVMRAKIDTDIEDLPADLKWRGIALDHYDGKGWSNTRDEFRRIRSTDNYGRILVSEDRRQKEFLVQQSILLEPFSKVIFGVPEMIVIAGDTLPRRFVFQDGNGSINVFRRGRGLLKYAVYSDVRTRHEKMVQPLQGSISERIQRRYLQLPGGSPRIRELAEEVTENQNRVLDKALAIERFLRGNYGYSLDNKSASAEDPLYDFLFVTKAGHCEYFATAQAILMRSIGIPARIVNGFRLGEFNEFSDYFIVRQSDAHSWVEGYFPGPGWLEFDATPWTFSDRKSLSLSDLFGQILDAIDIFWTEVVTFDRVKQVGFFRSLRYGVRNTWIKISHISLKLDDFTKSRWLDRFIDWDFSKVIYIGLIPLVLTVSWIGYRYRRYLKTFWKRRVLGQESSEIAPEYYLEMLDVLGRKGFVKNRAETPGEFVQRIHVAVGNSAPGLITELYYRNRFGHYPLGSSDLSKIYGWLKELRH